jgi:hypothetical protein
VARLDEALEAAGELLVLWPEVSRASYPEYAGDFFQAVPQASVMRDYHPLLVPGPLQTEEYARATLRAGNQLATEDEVLRLVETRMQRQEELAETETPVMWAIITEAVIRQLASDPDILLGQVNKLLELSEAGRVRLQVLPSNVGIRHHPGLSGPFTILSFADKPDVVYVEGVGSGSMISDPEKVEEISFKFGSLQAAALSPEQAVDLLESIKGEFNGSRLAQVQLQQSGRRTLRGDRENSADRSSARHPEP